MGLRRRGQQDEMHGRRYMMREKLLSIGDDYWIEDEAGQRVFKVDGKALRVRDTFVLEDVEGHELAKIQERKLRVRDTMTINIGDRNVTVKKAIIGLRDRFKVEVDGGPDLKVQGNIVDHEYEIEADGDTLGLVSKKWFRARETYGVDVAANADPVLMLAVTVAVDAMSHD